MATQETQLVDNIISSRRAIMLGGGALAALALTGSSAKAQAATVTDNDVLNFALNLEYLEGEFYTLASKGQTLTQAGIGTGAGTTTAGTATVTTKGSNNYTSCKVTFTIPLVEAYALEIAAQEQAHVTFLRSVLGANAVAEPNVDLYNSFNGLVKLLGIGLTTFDPFANDYTFLLGSYVFEDVGVSAYHGGAGLLTSAVTLEAAAQIHATEAYHASTVRTTLYNLDQTGNSGLGPAGILSTVTQKISALRAQLSGTSGAMADDIGVDGTQTVTLNGMTLPTVTYVDADSNSIGFARTPSQVLSIVYASSTSGTASGGFFPAGLNGTVKAVS